MVDLKAELEWGLAIYQATGQGNITIKPESAKYILKFIDKIKDTD